MRQFLILSVLFTITIALAVPTAAQVVKPLDEVFPYNIEHPLAGMFHGGIVKDETGEPDEAEEADTPEEPPEASFAELIVEYDEESGYTIKVTCISLMLVQDTKQELRFNDGHLSFSGVAGWTNSRFSFDGELSEDGQRLTGSMTVTVEGEEPATTRWVMGRVPKVTDLPNHRTYAGEVATEVGPFGMSLCFGQTPGGHWLGTLDIPLQNLPGLPLINFSQDETGLITASTPTNPPAIVKFRIDDDSDRMVGSFAQSGPEFAIDFARDGNVAAGVLERPQTPMPPYPYEERVVIARHPGGFSLAGTLTIPDPAKHGEGPYPTAVLISGSGQQDRDSTIFGHKPFHVLADFLTRQGIAVMRYDDRGVAGSRVDDTSLVLQATTAGFATDTRAVVDALKNLPEIDGDRIGLIGHSEGGVIAPMVATDGHEDIAFVVLLAAPGVTGGELMLKQNEALFSASGAPPEAITTIVDRLARTFELINDDAGDAELQQAVRLLIEAQFAVSGQTPGDEVLDAAAAKSVGQLTSPWFRFFLAYDPAPALENVRCPVLALNGGRDLQVWSEQNLPAIEAAIKRGGGQVTTRVFPTFNHLFQPAETGMVSEYRGISVTMDGAALEIIADWIIARVGMDEAPIQSDDPTTKPADQDND